MDNADPINNVLGLFFKYKIISSHLFFLSNVEKCNIFNGLPIRQFSCGMIYKIMNKLHKPKKHN